MSHTLDQLTDIGELHHSAMIELKRIELKAERVGDATLLSFVRSTILRAESIRYRLLALKERERCKANVEQST